MISHKQDVLVDKFKDTIKFAKEKTLVMSLSNSWSSFLRNNVGKRHHRFTCKRYCRDNKTNPQEVCDAWGFENFNLGKQRNWFGILFLDVCFGVSKLPRQSLKNLIENAVYEINSRRHYKKDNRSTLGDLPRIELFSRHTNE